ncbi:MAG: low molecular weight phosphatase family protein [Desulfobacteraceae bacterium]
MVVSPDKARGVKILFVCLGNICRSPMAAGLACQLFPEGSYVDSAGLNPIYKRPTPEAIQVMETEAGIDISGHYSKPVAAVNLGEFDYIIALDAAIYTYLKRIYPQADHRLISWNIADPYSGGINAYLECFREIRLKLEDFSRQVAEHPS